MNLRDHYPGGDDRFEGDRTLTLYSLPAGARVTKATITLTPTNATGGTLFEEVIDNFDPGGQGDLGTTKSTGTGFVEVDFHARRTLASVDGAQDASLSVDLGGAYLDVSSRGTIPGSANDQFIVKSDGKLPSLAVNKCRLSGTPPNVTTVTIRSVPTNITVRLGQLPPFWIRPGEFAVSDTSPDFAPILNAFLITIHPRDGFYTIPFVIHSDTIARLDVDASIDFVIDQPILPSYLPEVTLPYSFSTLPGADEALTTVLLPRGARLVSGQSGAQVRGEFQPTRVAQGLVGEEPRSFGVEVSPACTLAQLLQPDKEKEVIGVDLPLGTTLPGLAGINVAIQSDNDGKPSGEVLASANVVVGKPLPGQSSWGSAKLATPLRLGSNPRYWLVLQSQLGKASWSATAGRVFAPAIGDVPLQCSRDGGLSWRTATTPEVIGQLAGLMRLRDQPDRFTIPIQLQIGKGVDAVRRPLDEFAPLGRVEFNFDFADKLAEFLASQATTSPCGNGNLLTNGDFSAPPPDDATRRLFGMDSAEPEFDGTGGRKIRGTVDLSRSVDLRVERFIRLEADGTGPKHIDCAGAAPSRTTLGEIIQAVNEEYGGQSIAFEIQEST